MSILITVALLVINVALLASGTSTYPALNAFAAGVMVMCLVKQIADLQS